MAHSLTARKPWATYVISGPTTKRAELSGVIADLGRRIAQHRADLVHIDAVLRLYSEAEPESIARYCTLVRTISYLPNVLMCAPAPIVQTAYGIIEYFSRDKTVTKQYQKHSCMANPKLEVAPMNYSVALERNSPTGALECSDNKASWQIQSYLPVRYDVYIADDLFSPRNPTLIENEQEGVANTRLIIIDSAVDRLHGNRIRSYFAHYGVMVQVCSLDVSESVKRFDTAMAIVEQLERHGVLRRDNPFIAIGGGVLLDLAGFAASLYRRGIPHVRVPTNLMALIDASLGVKTGINVGDRRNRLGTYHPPVAAYLDRSFLATVPQRDISNGLGEILKLAVIKDAELFQLLESGAETLLEEKLQDATVAPLVIQRSVRGMLEELAPNLWERDLERCVDFGHSFSPLVEMRALPELLHGEAVALDVLLSCFLAAGRGLISWHDVGRVRGTMTRLRLPSAHPLFADADTLWESLADATRHRNGKQRLPLPKGIGSYVFINDLTRDELERAMAKCLASGGN